MSTLKTSNIQHASAASAAITLDANGQATLNGLAYPTAGSLSNRNLIINGAMQVAQRGTSSTSNEYATVDRFKVSINGGSITQSQESLSSGDPYDEGFRNFYRCTNSTTATAAGDYKIITHFVEAQNMANSGWNYTSAASNVILSFWARASVGQDYTFYFRTNDGTAQAYSFIFTLAANTWTKITHIVPGAAAVAFDDDNGTGLQLTWAPWLGTNFTDSGHTHESWAAVDASSISTDMTTTWASTTNATFDLTGVQLEVGSVATPFEHRSYGDELARCQRYCYVWVKQADGGSPPLPGLVAFWNSSATYCTIHFPVTMRAAPSLTCPSRTNLLAFYTGNGTRNASTWTATQINEKAMTMNATSSGTQGDAGNGVIQTSTMSAGDFVAWIAEL